MDGAERWTLRLTRSAERDFSGIVRWSAERFGPAQARLYGETLSVALQDLAAGPAFAGVAVRDDIAAGLLTLHVARRRRSGLHFALFRVAEHDARVIDVLRILHDAIDLPRHVPSPAADG